MTCQNNQPSVTQSWPLWNYVIKAALDFSLDPCLVAAVVWTESSGNKDARRFEPLYSYPYKVNAMAKAVGLSSDAMLVAQCTSFGLMQIMYAVALELGFRGKPEDLYDVETGLHWGCMHLANKARHYGQDPASIYAAYNGGSPRRLADGAFANQKHVDRFLMFYREIINHGQQAGTAV